MSEAATTDAIILPRSKREQKRRAREDRDIARGYSINTKYLTIAFVSEGLVIALSLVAAVLFALMYGRGDYLTMGMMMLAPIGYAVVEMSRVPLAVLTRTQPNWILKALFIAGVIFAAVVTTKSLSQLGEIMFRPRMMEVSEAHHDYNEAVSRRDAFQGEFNIRKGQLDQANEALVSANETAAKQIETLGTTGKTQMCPYTYVDRRTRRTVNATRPCPESEASKTTRNQINDQRGNVPAARERVDAAEKYLKTLGTAQEVEARVVQTKKAYDRAVMNSQLHAFTGMFFAKDPALVTEGELSNFLRIFVFIPAICASLASTLLAMGSVTKITPKRLAKAAAAKKAGTVPVTGGRYVLDETHKRFVEKAMGSEPLEAPRHITPNLKIA